MTILTGHRTTALDVKPGRGVVATLYGPGGAREPRDFSHVIVAVGIVPNPQNIGLETRGVTMERGPGSVNEYGPHHVAGIWGIGNDVGRTGTAPKAHPEGITRDH